MKKIDSYKRYAIFVNIYYLYETKRFLLSWYSDYALDIPYRLSKTPKQSLHDVPGIAKPCECYSTFVKIDYLQRLYSPLSHSNSDNFTTLN